MKHILYIVFLSFSVFISVESHTCGTDDDDLEKLWADYKIKFNKNYVGHAEKARKEAWMKNCAIIRKHNREAKSGIHNFTITDNGLADMSIRHYHKTMTKLIHSRKRDLNPDIVGSFNIDASTVPNKMDWREMGFITQPNNQKDCGSCYAFSITQALQAQVYKQTNISVPLSVQQIVDCSTIKGNYGCGGGSLRNTLKYLDTSGGVMTEKEYPYAAKQTACKYIKNRAMVNLTSWAILPADDEKMMKYVVGTIGPVAASLNASPHTFQLYKSGVYDDPKCPTDKVNHAVLVVGYTKNAWILKNWWGSRWGEDGYMRLKRGKNTCGILNYVAYALV